MSTAPNTTATKSNLCPNSTDDNGKYKRHQNCHNHPLSFLQRWLSRHGKSMVILSTTLIMSVFFLPPLKSIESIRKKQQSNQLATLMIQSQKVQKILEVPPCPHSPWKPNEDLVGKCPGDLHSFPSATSVASCASSCCENSGCMSWQYRSDVGCLQGKDIRLGMEKDGPAAWCSDHPPHKWNGQYLKPHGKTKSGVDLMEMREKACNEQTWNPNEEVGQCFGLGDVKKNASSSAETCMRACCNDKNCGAWQWNKELGCFYNRGMHGCQGDGGDPVQFEPFVGRRKIVEGRKYTDGMDKPWQQALS